MSNKITKRDGREVPFDKTKIINAVEKAFISVDNEVSAYATEKASNIANYIETISVEKDLSIEEIQDYVEKGLMSTKRSDVAKAYILYREQRSKIRHNNTRIMKIFGEKIMAKNIQNQNANVDEGSFGGRKGESSDEIAKQYALDNLMSPLAVYNHIHNIIYTHDLSSYAVGMHNCLSIPYDLLLAVGFNTRQTDVRPANSIGTAFQLLAVIAQLQSLQQFGGVSATHLDWTMIPYVRKSFFKHYVIAYIKTKPEFLDFDLEDMLFDDYEDEIGITRCKFDDWLDENKQKCLEELNMTFDDFRFDNKEAMDKALYQSALFDTINETKQAVEGMYHNLNY